MKYGLGEYSVIFKALGDETRLRILTMLTQGSMCTCNILEAFHFTQPTLSYHMKQLTDSGLVNAKKNGKFVRYTINSERMQLLLEFITTVNEINDLPVPCCDTK
jgi:ArsR family transcriptional regulator